MMANPRRQDFEYFPVNMWIVVPKNVNSNGNLMRTASVSSSSLSLEELWAFFALMFPGRLRWEIRTLPARVYAYAAYVIVCCSRALVLLSSTGSRFFSVFDFAASVFSVPPRYIREKLPPVPSLFPEILDASVIRIFNFVRCIFQSR